MNKLKANKAKKDSENGLHINVDVNNDNALLYDDSTNNNNNNMSIISLDIAPIDNIGDDDLQTEYEDLIASQLTVQNVIMMNTVHQSNEKPDKILCKFGKNVRQQSIKVCDIPANGDCLFSAISHQLYSTKINSLEHQKDTKDLRSVVVEHIEMNLEPYLHNIKNRVLESGQKLDDQLQEEQCLEFVKNQLGKSGTFGGTESINAISKVKEVNIVIFNEKGICYFGSEFNPTFKRTIMIAFRGSSDCQKNEDRNHFGSVAELNTNLISDVSQHLIDNHMKYLQSKIRNSIVIIE